MSIKFKLIISLTTILIICAISVFHSTLGSKKITTDVTNVKEHIYPKLNRIRELIEYIGMVQQAKMNALRERDDEYLEDVEEYVWEFDAILEVINKDHSDTVLLGVSERLDAFVDQPLKLEQSLSEQDQQIMAGVMLAESNTLMIDLEQYRTDRFNVFQQSLDDIRQQSLDFRSLSLTLSGILILVVGIISLVMVGIVRNIQSLVDSANHLSDGNLDIPILHSSKGELGSLQIAFEKMRLHVKDHIENLDSRVVERTQQLSVAKQETDDIMGAVEIGIFTFNLDKSVNAEHSEKAKGLFGTENFEQSSLKNLLEMDGRQLQQFDRWLSLCGSKSNLRKQWRMFSRLNPVDEICKSEGENVIEINYQPIVVDNKLTKIMVLARDITHERAVEEDLARSKIQQESMMRRMMGLLNSDAQEIREFLEYAETQMTNYNQYCDMHALEANVEELFRALHTLKSHSGTLGFDDFSEQIASAEHLLDKIRKNEKCEIGEWLENIQLARTELDHILDLRNKIFRRQDSDRMSINRNLYDQILQKVRGNEAYSNLELTTQLMELSMQSFGSYCEKYRKLVVRFSHSLDKPIDDLIIETPDKMVDRAQLKRVDDAVVHIIRNAIDHGIEDEETRDQQNKGAGQIGLSLGAEDNDLILTISDDGAGLDPEKIASLAMEKNIIQADECHMLSNEEKINLIFLPGLTSKNDVTELSGRGVGMNAVADIMQEIGGDIGLTSNLGKGTTFSLRFPVQ
ncbi:MAG: Hpt domain-containing protein [Pseudomonadales bacterium]|nr:Hpt domain-containing protein [Pseudomonadales bacterium]